MLRAVVLTQYRRVTDKRTDGQTDRQTDGIAVASTELTMRALRRAVKKLVKQQYVLHMSLQYGELWPISGEFGAPQHTSTGFASWQRYCTAL